MLTVTSNSIGPEPIGAATAAEIRAPTAAMSSIPSTESRSTTNSSPPSRATVSPGRRTEAIRSALVRRTRSPFA